MKALYIGNLGSFSLWVHWGLLISKAREGIDRPSLRYQDMTPRESNDLFRTAPQKRDKKTSGGREESIVPAHQRDSRK